MSSRTRYGGLSDSLSGFVVENPWKALLIPALIIFLAIPGLRGLAPDSTYRAYFKPNDTLRLQVEEMERRFSNDDSIVLMVHQPRGVFNPDTARLLVALTEEMWRVPEVVRVESLSNYRWVEAAGDDITVDALIPDQGPLSESFLDMRGKQALHHEIVPEYLLSADGTTALVIGFVRPGDASSSPAPGPVVDAVRDMVERHKDSGHSFHISGRVAVEQALMESAQHDMRSFMPLLLLVMGCLLFTIFRQVRAALVPLLLVILGVISAMGVTGWLRIPISNITALVPQFMVGVGVATSVHILNTYYRARGQGKSAPDAMRHALAVNALPTLLTTFTTSMGFFSFMTSDITAIGNLGLVVGVGTALIWLMIYFLLGPVFVLLSRFGRTSANRHTVVKVGALPGAYQNGYVAALARYRWWIASGFLLLLAVAAFTASRNQVNANPFRYFAEGHWVRDANDFAEDHINGAQGIEVVINAGTPDAAMDPGFLKRVEAYQAWIAQQDGVVKTISLLDLLKQTNRSLHGDQQEFYRLPEGRQALSQLLFLYTLNLPQGLDVSNRITAEQDALRISVKWTHFDSSKATEAARKILVEGAARGFEVDTTGKVLLFQKLNGYVVQSFVMSIGVATILIGLLMMFALRSVRLGLISLIPNLFPLVVGAAALVAVGKSFDIGTVVVMTVCLSIAIDDTIHFISGFRRGLKNGMNAQQSIGYALSEVAPAMAITTLVLGCAFGVFMFAEFVPNQTFGFIAALVLTVALLVDLTLLPVLLLLLYSPGAGKEKNHESSDEIGPEGDELTSGAN